MNEMFNEAIDWSHRNVLRSLELTFMRCTHRFTPTELHNIRKMVPTAEDVPFSKDYYVNMLTSLCQWTCPYHPRIFRSQDVEIDAFVAIAIQHDVLPSSPLLEFMHIAPKDLWPNADMFNRIIKERKKAQQA